MAEKGVTILAELIDPSHECYCLSMTLAHTGILLCSVHGWEQPAASSEQRVMGTDGSQAVMLPQQEI